MTISQRIRSQLFATTVADANAAVPVSCSSPILHHTSTSAVSRSKDASTLSSSSLASAHATEDVERVLIRLPLTRPLPGGRKRPSRAKLTSARVHGLGWSDDEHERFLRGLELFPSGPWKHVAACVGTRTTRQVMTHAQKYRQKIARRQRGFQSIGTVKLEAVELSVVDSVAFRGAASPSSGDQLESSHIHYVLPTQVPLTVDELQLLDELFADPLWSLPHHLEDDTNVEFLLLLDDPLAQSVGGASGSCAAQSEDLAADRPLAPWMTSSVTSRRSEILFGGAIEYQL